MLELGLSVAKFKNLLEHSIELKIIQENSQLFAAVHPELYEKAYICCLRWSKISVLNGLRKWLKEFLR